MLGLVGNKGCSLKCFGFRVFRASRELNIFFRVDVL